MPIEPTGRLEASRGAPRSAVKRPAILPLLLAVTSLSWPSSSLTRSASSCGD